MTVQELTDYAKSFAGKVQYVFGGEDVANGKLDCSSYIQTVYAKAGVSLPRTTQEQANVGSHVDPSDAKEGDMVMFKNTYTTGISHVGYYLGNNQVLHNSSNGITISDLSSGYYAEHFAEFRRVLDDKTMSSIKTSGSDVSGVGDSESEISLDGGLWYQIVKIAVVAVCILLGFLFLMNGLKVEV